MLMHRVRHPISRWGAAGKAYRAEKLHPKQDVLGAMHKNFNGAVNRLANTHQGKYTAVGLRKLCQVSRARREKFRPWSFPFARWPVT